MAGWYQSTHIGVGWDVPRRRVRVSGSARSDQAEDLSSSAHQGLDLCWDFSWIRGSDWPADEQFGQLGAKSVPSRGSPVHCVRLSWLYMPHAEPPSVPLPPSVSESLFPCGQGAHSTAQPWKGGGPAGRSRGIHVSARPCKLVRPLFVRVESAARGAEQMMWLRTECGSWKGERLCCHLLNFLPAASPHNGQLGFHRFPFFFFLFIVPGPLIRARRRTITHRDPTTRSEKHFQPRANPIFPPVVKLSNPRRRASVTSSLAISNESCPSLAEPTALVFLKRTRHRGAPLSSAASESYIHAAPRTRALR